MSINFLSEYERRLKDLLQVPESTSRLVVYYGIATGYVDAILIAHPDVMDIQQLSLHLKAHKATFLGKIVELTIVNSVDLEKAIDNTIAYRLNSLKPNATTPSGASTLSDCFCLSNFIPREVLDAIIAGPSTFVNAVFTTTEYIKAGEAFK